MHKINNFNPYLAKNQLKYVTDVIKTGWIADGSYIKQVEDKVKKLLGVEYVLLCNSGTSACTLALYGCEIGKGDLVFAPSLTYIATTNSILSVGAIPHFIDVNKYFVLDTDEIKSTIIFEKIIPKAIMGVNLLGHSVDYDNFNLVCKENNIKVIEDNCQAPFAKYNGKFTGTTGDASAFSFFANKVISCGEGGMVIFKKKEDYERALLYRNQGRDYKLGRYYHSIYGENMVMTNLSAAILLAQLEDLDYILSSRKEIYGWYKKELENTIGLRIKPISDNCEPVNWYFSILIENRERYIKVMNKKGIGVNMVWKCNHEMPYLNKYLDSNFPLSHIISKLAVMLPTYTGMTKKEVKIVCDSTKEFIRNGK